MSSNAFSPQPLNSACISCSQTKSTPIQVKGALNNATQRMIYNAGPNAVFFAWGSDNTITPAIPVAGTPKNGIIVLAGAVVVESIPPNAWFSAICATGETGSLYLTPGEGN